MHNVSQKQINTLQIILEDLKNHLTIIGGFVQISSENKALMHINIINDSIVKSNYLIGKAISILNDIEQH
ncbi:hypothetical protein V6C27_14375 [Peptococcaceae bacterium 1198_IL3148]